MGSLGENSATVSFAKMRSLGDSSDTTLMIIGQVAAAMTGAALPSFVFLMGEVMDSFDPTNNDPTATLDSIKKISLIFVLIGIGVWLFSHVYYVTLLIFSAKVARKTKVAYLKAILAQDISWFDM